MPRGVLRSSWAAPVPPFPYTLEATVLTTPPAPLLPDVLRVCPHVSHGARCLRSDVVPGSFLQAPAQIKQFADWHGNATAGKDRLYVLVYPRLAEPAFLDAKRLPKGEATHYALGLLSGLARAHSVGVIHGDIKVDHVLVNGPSRGYSVIDWDGGIDVFEAAGADPSYTRIGAEACYWEVPIVHRGAPEIVLDYYSQRRNCTVTPAIDVWEAGVAFASVLLGCPLFAPQKLSTDPTSAPTRLHAIVNLLGTLFFLLFF